MKFFPSHRPLARFRGLTHSLASHPHDEIACKYTFSSRLYFFFIVLEIVLYSFVFPLVSF